MRERAFLHDWTIDYGDGPEPIELPHAWRQDVAVTEEGPFTYACRVPIPSGATGLRFWGASYAAEVFLDGERVQEHRGIWDAFDVPISRRAGSLDVLVKVTKNGGATFPVRDVASGFLPYVFHTFGGLHGPVEFTFGDEPLDPPAPSSRVRTEGGRIFVDDQPFYMRGLLHWGWYPEVGHPNAPEDTVRREIQQARALGFNVVKFCLWVPSHRYLEILKEEGMEAWIELPLWDPTDDPDRQREIGEEMERIVRQFRRHDNIICWTVGCELSGATSPEYRSRLVNLVRALTGCPLVKDNSGGAEMYGGDLREFGDFYDYHPYCDTPYYPLVLDSLLPGPRAQLPVLLGEFNDIDVHRDLSELAMDLPYWGSGTQELNDKGVRWQHDLPRILTTSRFAQEPEENDHETLIESSRRKALWIRKTVQEAVRARDPIAGYVITGWRDTPISTAGFFNDYDAPRFTVEETAAWNGPSVAFLIPTRRPPWVRGGNRVGYLDPWNFHPGQLFWRVGVHREREGRYGLVWRITDASGTAVAQGAEPVVEVAPLTSTQVGEISWFAEAPGEYRLEVAYGDTQNAWDLWVTEKPDWGRFHGWEVDDPSGRVKPLESTGGPNRLATRLPADLDDRVRSGAKVVLLLDEQGTREAPFWRESAYTFAEDPFLREVPLAERWGRLHAVSGDRVIDVARLGLPEDAAVEVLIQRVDVRTYEEAPVLLRARWGGGELLATTLRPDGGLGVQPSGLVRNPAGAALLAGLLGSVGD